MPLSTALAACCASCVSHCGNTLVLSGKKSTGEQRERLRRSPPDQSHPPAASAQERGRTAAVRNGHTRPPVLSRKPFHQTSTATEREAKASTCCSPPTRVRAAAAGSRSSEPVKVCPRVLLARMGLHVLLLFRRFPPSESPSLCFS